jgi:hypothetical protein
MSTPISVSFPVRIPLELKAQVSQLSIDLGISEQDIMRLCLRIGLTDIESIKKDHATLVKEAADECGTSFASWAKDKASTKPQERVMVSDLVSDIVTKPTHKTKPAAREPFVLTGSRQSSAETAVQKGGGAVTKARRLAAEILAGDKK